jgi:hypothetical protein
LSSNYWGAAYVDNLFVPITSGEIVIASGGQLIGLTGISAAVGEIYPTTAGGSGSLGTSTNPWSTVYTETLYAGATTRAYGTASTSSTNTTGLLNIAIPASTACAGTARIVGRDTTSGVILCAVANFAAHTTDTRCVLDLSMASGLVAGSAVTLGSGNLYTATSNPGTLTLGITPPSGDSIVWTLTVEWTLC